MKKIIFLLIWISCAFALEQGDLVPSLKVIQLVTPSFGPYKEITAKNEGNNFVLVEFMSITCGPCVNSLGDLQALADEIAATTTTKLIAVDRDSTQIGEFWKQYKEYFQMPFMIDPTREAAKVFKIKYTPTMFLIDNDNNIILKHIGSIDPETAEMIKNLVL